MKKQPDGAWMVQIQLTHGHHQYLFWVDGQAQLDLERKALRAPKKVNRVSLLAIS